MQASHNKQHKNIKSQQQTKMTIKRQSRSHQLSKHTFEDDVLPTFRPSKYLSLLEWIAQSEPRLRLVMGQYHQIDLRDAMSFVNSSWSLDFVLDDVVPHQHSRNFHSHHRQLGAFCQLLEMARHDPDGHVTYWA
eukprot:c6930_g1_i3.p2 GENE.c6930_g1_i3~~c6930_g1_i3.p2  ORF type:complete len:134 (+),score=29.18 c6930_g1_i3:676-1077(+)